MKGCLVMAAHALGAAQTTTLDGIGEIEVLVVADEELGSVSSRDWIEERARGASACLGLEAGWPGGGVVVARGAVGALTLRAVRSKRPLRRARGPRRERDLGRGAAGRPARGD